MHFSVKFRYDMLFYNNVSVFLKIIHTPWDLEWIIINIKDSNSEYPLKQKLSELE